MTNRKDKGNQQDVDCKRNIYCALMPALQLPYNLLSINRALQNVINSISPVPKADVIQLDGSAVPLRCLQKGGESGGENKTAKPSSYISTKYLENPEYRLTILSVNVLLESLKNICNVTGSYRFDEKKGGLQVKFDVQWISNANGLSEVSDGVFYDRTRMPIRCNKIWEATREIENLRINTGGLASYYKPTQLLVDLDYVERLNYYYDICITCIKEISNYLHYDINLHSREALEKAVEKYLELYLRGYLEFNLDGKVVKVCVEGKADQCEGRHLEKEKVWTYAASLREESSKELRMPVGIGVILDKLLGKVIRNYNKDEEEIIYAKFYIVPPVIVKLFAKLYFLQKKNVAVSPV